MESSGPGFTIPPWIDTGQRRIGKEFNKEKRNETNLDFFTACRSDVPPGGSGDPAVHRYRFAEEIGDPLVCSGRTCDETGSFDRCEDAGRGKFSGAENRSDPPPMGSSSANRSIFCTRARSGRGGNTGSVSSTRGVSPEASPMWRRGSIRPIPPLGNGPGAR